jgi:hypothetical protein
MVPWRQRRAEATRRLVSSSTEVRYAGSSSTTPPSSIRFTRSHSSSTWAYLCATSTIDTDVRSRRCAIRSTPSPRSARRAAGPPRPRAGSGPRRSPDAARRRAGRPARRPRRFGYRARRVCGSTSAPGSGPRPRRPMPSEERQLASRRPRDPAANVGGRFDAWRIGSARLDIGRLTARPTGPVQASRRQWPLSWRRATR